MNEQKLLPCPHCGGEAQISPCTGTLGDSIWVPNCKECAAMIKPWPDEFRTEEKAKEAMRRAPLPDNKALTVEELRGMESERVWVQFRGIGMYALVAYHADPDGDDGDDVYLTNNLGGRDTYEGIIGQGGYVCRRPPEKGE